MGEKVDKELDGLQEEGIISPITNSSWTDAVVPVVKPNGIVHLCGDYKLTVNKVARIDAYLILTLDDLFNGLPSGIVFSKLDASQAYPQLCLDEESEKYTVINTHYGLFKYNTLSFGIYSTLGIFQRALENLLKDIPRVLCYLDDILITGATETEYKECLRKVLAMLQSAGLWLSIEKCSISVPHLSYLGFLIDEEGIHSTQEKVRVRVTRQNTELRSVETECGQRFGDFFFFS